MNKMIKNNKKYIPLILKFKNYKIKNNLMNKSTMAI